MTRTVTGHTPRATSIRWVGPIPAPWRLSVPKLDRELLEMRAYDGIPVWLGLREIDRLMGFSARSTKSWVRWLYYTEQRMMTPDIVTGEWPGFAGRRVLRWLELAGKIGEDDEVVPAYHGGKRQRSYPAPSRIRPRWADAPREMWGVPQIARHVGKSPDQIRMQIRRGQWPAPDGLLGDPRLERWAGARPLWWPETITNLENP